MTLKECYASFGGDFDGVLGRLQREQLVKKFVYKFLDDQSYALFEDAMEKEDYDQALRAVHTLKGICQNLSFTQLYESSNATTQALKENDYQKTIRSMPRLAEDYYRLMDAIRAYQAQEE